MTRKMMTRTQALIWHALMTRVKTKPSPQWRGCCWTIWTASPRPWRRSVRIRVNNPPWDLTRSVIRDSYYRTSFGPKTFHCQQLMPLTKNTKRFYQIYHSLRCAKSSLDDGSRAKHAIEGKGYVQFIWPYSPLGSHRRREACDACWLEYSRAPVQCNSSPSLLARARGTCPRHCPQLCPCHAC